MNPRVRVRWSAAISGSGVGSVMVPAAVRVVPVVMSNGDSPSPVSWIHTALPDGSWAQKPSSAGTSVTVKVVGAMGQPTGGADCWSSGAAGGHVGCVGAVVGGVVGVAVLFATAAGGADG